MIAKKGKYFYLVVLSFRENGQIAQSVEQRTENPCVAGSIPVLATISLAGECRSIAVTLDFLKSPKTELLLYSEVRFGVSVPLNLRHQH
jgi:hypothetical protein